MKEYISKIPYELKIEILSYLSEEVIFKLGNDYLIEIFYKNNFNKHIHTWNIANFHYNLPLLKYLYKKNNKVIEEYYCQSDYYVCMISCAAVEGRFDIIEWYYSVKPELFTEKLITRMDFELGYKICTVLSDDKYTYNNAKEVIYNILKIVKFIQRNFPEIQLLDFDLNEEYYRSLNKNLNRLK